MKFRILFLYTSSIILLNAPSLKGQPVLSSRFEMEGVHLFRDVKDADVIYHIPGRMGLAVDKSGRPKFQLLQMRYTGTGLSGDQGEKRFFNVVQLQISLLSIPDSIIRSIQQNLGSEKIMLKPIPIHHLDAVLVLPFGDEGRNRKIGSSGGTGTTEGEAGVWTERSFSIRLENHEAQILWEQVRKGQLAVSVSYCIYAELVPGISGHLLMDTQDETRSKPATAADAVIHFDSSSTMQVLDAGAFSIQIDPVQWPETLQRIDLNETNSNVWAMLEVRCYDFTNQLRPDLGIKAVEFQATDAHGQLIYSPGVKFSSLRPDFNTQQFRFPIAVNLQQPYRYKVTEYDSDGTKRSNPWQTMGNWNKILDVTTSPERLRTEIREIVLEVDPDLLQDTSHTGFMATIAYQRNGQPKTMSLQWEKNDPELKTLSIIADKHSQILCYPSWLQKGALKQGEPTEVRLDNYLFFDKP